LGEIIGSSVAPPSKLTSQYIVNYNLREGWYLESNATITANWVAASQDRWTVPLGGGLGRVFKIGNSKLNSVQGFYNVLSPSHGPNWELIAQFQIIFSLPGQ
jgi:hypothetical protein